MKLNNINVLISIAKRAGEIILYHYGKNLSIEYKNDKTPVTNADIASNQFIIKELNYYFPDIPCITEEDNDHKNNVTNELFWLVDPLDGTRSFARKGKNFTVNIALIHNGLPLVGVIYHPCSQELFHNLNNGYAVKIDSVGNESQINGGTLKTKNIVLIGTYSSKSEKQLSNFLTQFDEDNTRIMQKSSSIKFCLLAEGKGDIYPRFGITKEWDTAAGHSILKSAGGTVVDLNGIELKYNKNYFINNGFIAFSNKLKIEEINWNNNI